MDNLLSARLLMTNSLVFHMVFAAIGIGLPLLLVIVEGRFLTTGQEHYRQLARKWAKATGMLFAVGAVSGTALSFELGLLWPKYMEMTGAVVGHIFGLEGFAFFTEAIFIGLYLYGWDRLSPRAHWLCGVVIAISGMVSGLLILGVNSWMQAPVGFTLDEAGKVLVTDPIAIFKRPLWAYMAIHSTLSCYMAVGFAVAAVYAAGWLRGRRDAYHRSAINVAMAVGAVAAVLQPISGDFLAKFVFQTQPAKFAAMEGQFVTQTHAPLRIGGLPDVQTGQTRFAIELPAMLSVLAGYTPGTQVTGLNDIPRDNWPPVEITHIAFQIMVGLGMFLLAVSVWYWIGRWRRGESVLAGNRLPLAIIVAGPMGFVALQAGWFVTEVGRQPWVIQGILRTSASVTPAAGVVQVLYGFTAMYIMLGATVIWLLRYMARPSTPDVRP